MEILKRGKPPGLGPLYSERLDRGDIKAIVEALVEKAKSGDVVAARELLSRAIGPYVEVDLLARIAELEHYISGLAEEGGEQ